MSAEATGHGDVHQRIQAAGKQVVVYVYSLMKTGELHDLNNDAYVRPNEKLSEALEGLSKIERQALTLVLHEGIVQINSHALWLDANTQDPLFPVWRHHPFFTTNPDPAADADSTHRRHAVCETVWSDLIDGPWAHQPSGSFAANAAWCILAAICHNLLRAAGTLTGAARYPAARGATLRTHLINVPARLARPQRRPVLHLPARWPAAAWWTRLLPFLLASWPAACLPACGLPISSRPKDAPPASGNAASLA